MNLRRITFGLLFTYGVLTGYGMLLAAMRLPAPFPLTPVSTLLAFAFAILHAGQRVGWKKMLVMVVVVVLTGLTFESIGVATGWVYGPYHYTDQLGVKFLNLVPLLIPVAWTMMMYPSLVIAESLTPDSLAGSRRWLVVAALGGVVMTAWDVGMDPMMVSGGNWVWEVSGPYFGVPLQNFWGWWLTTFVALAVYQLIARSISEQPRGVAQSWALWAYLITAASTVMVDIAINLDGPALAGLFAMLPWVAMAFLREIKGKQTHG